jgi:drug/metabolite transporter (DMT)-like permease
MGGQVRSLDRFGAATILSLCVVWGFNPIVIKIALVDVGPFAVSSIRCLIGCLCIGLYAVTTKRAIFRLDGTEWLGVLLGLLYAGQFMTLFEAMQLTTVAHSIVFLYAAPLLVAVGATFFLKDEGLRHVQWAGLGLAFFGLSSEYVARWGVAHPAGDALALLSALLWAAATLLIKGTRLSRLDPVKTLLYQIGLMAIVCPFAAWGFGEPAPTGLAFWAYVALFWQGAVVVGFTYALWIWLLGQYPAAQLSAFGFVTPLIGVVAAAMILGEPLTTGLAAASALVIAGLILVAWAAASSGFPNRPARSWMNCQAVRPEREPRVVAHSSASASN